LLLGARPEAPSDESLRRENEIQLAHVAAERNARRERLALSGGHLLSAAFQFLGDLLPAPSDTSELKSATNALAATLKQSLADPVAGTIKKIQSKCWLLRAAFDCDAIREFDPVFYEFAAFARVIDFHPLMRQLSHKALTPVFGQECLRQEVTLAGLLFPGRQSSASCGGALAVRNFFCRECSPKAASGWSI
jgi:hypothetical protein